MEMEIYFKREDGSHVVGMCTVFINEHDQTVRTVKDVYCLETDILLIGEELMDAVIILFELFDQKLSEQDQ